MNTGLSRAPFRRVDKETGIVTDEVTYMTADVEDEFIVAQANEPLDEQHRFKNPKVNSATVTASWRRRLPVRITWMFRRGWWFLSRRR